MSVFIFGKEVFMGLEVKDKQIIGYVDEIGIEELVIPEGIIGIKEGVFASCNLKKIVLPKSLEYIEDFAFCECMDLEEVIISENLSIFGDGIFLGCDNLKSINLQCSNFFISIDGVIYSKDKKRLVLYPNYKMDTEYTVLDGTKVISPYAFCESNVIKVNLPDSLECIGKSAFYRSQKLEIVNFNDNLDNIARFAFGGCTKLDNIKLPSALKVINEYTFEDCISLKNISLPETLSKIDSYAFSSCTSLEKITLNQNLELVNDLAFSKCLSLKNIFSEGHYYKSIDGVLYRYRQNLLSLIFYPPGKEEKYYDILDGTMSLGHYSVGSQNLLGVSIPNSVKKINWYAFEDSPNLKYIKVLSFETFIKLNYECKILALNYFVKNYNEFAEIDEFKEYIQEYKWELISYKDILIFMIYNIDNIFSYEEMLKVIDEVGTKDVELTALLLNYINENFFVKKNNNEKMKRKRNGKNENR